MLTTENYTRKVICMVAKSNLVTLFYFPYGMDMPACTTNRREYTFRRRPRRYGNAGGCDDQALHLVVMATSISTITVASNARDFISLFLCGTDFY